MIEFSAIKSEENSAKSRIQALQHINSLLENGFIEDLTRMASRAFLASVFGLIHFIFPTRVDVATAVIESVKRRETKYG